VFTAAAESVPLEVVMPILVMGVVALVLFFIMGVLSVCAVVAEQRQSNHPAEVKSAKSS
jgi:hypothetical protein